MNADIENLIAKDQISDLTRYCRALDWLDEGLFTPSSWPDAPIDYGFFMPASRSIRAACFQWKNVQREDGTPP